ncbi:MAG: hypothetical protein JST40_14260 [Armatimonadetes bacterium]|nr:hypothetical protein [Armatimonadota bacterium]
MVTCTSCGKIIDKVPNWLQSANVEFVCNNCPNRQIKPISQLAQEVAQATRNNEEDLAEMDELEEDEE